jgi:Lar family restriction alleviation protein
MDTQTPFQPRPCPFCGSRHLVNARDEHGGYKVTCAFCGACGPLIEAQDAAWDSWNGSVLCAPANFGRPEEL